MDPQIQRTPQTGDIWMHYRTKKKYLVRFLTNTESMDQDRYPTTVVYQNPNETRVWSRPLADWHRSMQFLGEIDRLPGSQNSFTEVPTAYRKPGLYVNDEDLKS